MQINLKISNARVQCYDSAATMPDKESGVTTQVKNNLNENCLHAHFQEQDLPLDVVDMIKNKSSQSDALDIMKVIMCKLLTRCSYETCAYERKERITRGSYILTNILEELNHVLLP